MANSDSGAFIGKLDRLWIGQPLPCPAREAAPDDFDATYIAYRPASGLPAPAAGDFGSAHRSRTPVSRCGSKAKR